MAERQRLPLLVLVSGPPGSGKTTVATELSSALNLPLVSLDQVKASIGIGLSAALTPDSGPAEGADSGLGGRAGQLAFDAAYAVLRKYLEHGVGVIAEKAWRRGSSEAELLALATGATAMQIHVSADRAVAVARGRQRPPRRGLVDMGAVEEALASGAMRWEDFDPLDLSLPLLQVRTDAGPIDLAAVERFVWRTAHRALPLEQGARVPR